MFYIGKAEGRALVAVVGCGLGFARTAANGDFIAFLSSMNAASAVVCTGYSGRGSTLAAYYRLVRIKAVVI